MDVTTILNELERAWEAGSLPGRQAAEPNAAWRQLWANLQRPPPGDAAVFLLRLIRS